jgi:hypothetical protein
MSRKDSGFVNYILIPIAVVVLLGWLLNLAGIDMDSIIATIITVVGFLVAVLIFGPILAVIFAILKAVFNIPIPNTFGGQMIMGIATAFILLLIGRVLGIDL